MQQRTVLYFYPQLSTFIQKDLDICAQHFQLRTHDFRQSGNATLIFRFISQFFFLLANIWQADVLVCRFIAYHSFLPTLFGKVFGKPVLCILGGTESHNFPSINYGSFRKPVYAWFTRQSFLRATHLAPVDASLVISDYTYTKDDFPQQGYQYFVPETTAPFTEIENGYDSAKFFPDHSPRVPNSFLTVASVFHGAEFYRKGVDMILLAAKNFPHCSFTIIGESNHQLPPLPNLKLIGAMSNSELLNHYRTHEFYFQLSIAEGFPNALCEAMLCGCIPIGSNVFAIPKIIGNTGFVLQQKDEAQLNELLQKALQSNRAMLSTGARERIATQFPLKKREEKLVALLRQLMAEKQ